MWKQRTGYRMAQLSIFEVLSRSRLRIAALMTLVLVGASPALAQKKATIVFSTTDQDVSYQPYGAYAAQAGWFKDAGLDVTIQTAGNSSQVLQLLLTGQAQFGMLNPDALYLAAEKGPLPLKMTYILIRKTIYTAVVPEGSPIKTFADLKGKTVGFPSSTTALQAYADFRYAENGFTAADTKVVETGYGVTSTIDAFIGWPGLFAAFTNAGYKFRVLPEAPWQNQYYGIGLVATADYIKNNPDVVEKISTGLAKTAVLLKSDPDKVVESFWKAYPVRAPLPGEDRAVALKKQRNILDATISQMRIDELPADFAWGSQDLATWERHLKLLKDTKLVTKDLTPADYFVDEFSAAANKFDRASVK
jgi:NitT/TauT family transport system substrate-binding protein